MYIGRFAPTPSGPLHFGSLIAAVGSYLQAKTQNGKWLIRIEDTDLQRNRKGADRQIIKTLEHFGFEWDDKASYQTQRSDFYEQALQSLQKSELIYACNCSRKNIIENGIAGEFGIIYAGTCANKHIPRDENTAIRLRVKQQSIRFTDKVFGEYKQNVATEVGDFHLIRRDQCYAYQLTAVVDDHLQGITEVVRGYDIIDSTPRQIFLQQCIGYTQPDYLHLPLATDKEGLKLSKHTFADAINDKSSRYFLYQALQFLGQKPEKSLLQASNQEIWQWAFNHWQVSKIPKQTTIYFEL